MDVLLLKLLLAPSLVVASTLAGRRWGSDAAGILVALPIVAGPILFISYLQHGADFAGRAADASLLGLVSLALFAVVFSRASRRFGWLVTLAVTWTVVLTADAALSFVHVPTLLDLVLTVVATLAAMRLMPQQKKLPKAPVQAWSRWDLPGRAVATGVLVLCVTTASGALGSRWTGLLAPFPIALSVVSAFVHGQRGPDAAASTLKGALTGLFGFATFCLCVALLVSSLGGGAFVIGAAAAVAVQLLAVRGRRMLNRKKAPLRSQVLK